jgi:hypothetical protein
MSKKITKSTLKLIKTKNAPSVGRRSTKTIEVIQEHRLTECQEEFCKQYILNKRNGKASVLAAYPNVKSENAASAMASEMLTHPKIQAKIAELEESVQKTLGTSLPWLAQEVANMVTNMKHDNSFKLECLKYLAELMGHNSKNNAQIIMQQNNLFQETQDEFKGKMG